MSEAYKRAGVSLQAGYEAVERIKKHVQSTARPGVWGSLGGFGGLFDLGGLGFRQPVLVAGADGVGTKVLISALTGKHDTVGIDLVAMCVNDILTQGAEPLFFLDYIACAENDPAFIEELVAGVAQGCVQAGCALLGGETAEMPGLYGPGQYDLAGFALGACEKEQIIDGSGIEVGDLLLGLPSSGLHSNGYSLVRRLLLQERAIDLDAHVEDLGCSWAQELLKPTRIYVKSLLPLLKEGKLKGLAHITGGGFFENIPRLLPPGLGASIRRDAWQPQPVFELLQALGSLSSSEMFEVFNMGVGMVVAADPKHADEIRSSLQERGECPYLLGEVRSQEGIVLL